MVGCSISEYPALFTDSPPPTKMAQSRFAAVTSNEISKINEEAIPDNTKKATKFGLAVFTGEALSV